MAIAASGTAWKVSKYSVFSGLYFPVFNSNMKKYDQKISVSGHFSHSRTVYFSEGTHNPVQYIKLQKVLSYMLDRILNTALFSLEFIEIFFKISNNLLNYEKNSHLTSPWTDQFN